MSYLRYLCLFVHNGAQHILCCVFVLSFFVLCALCCQFLWIVIFFIAPSVFYSVYCICDIITILILSNTYIILGNLKRGYDPF